MQDGTLETIKVLLRNDPTVPLEGRTAIIDLASNNGVPRKFDPQSLPLFVKRRQAAQLLGRNERSIDLLCAEGHLQKVVRDGKTQSYGITRKSLLGFLSKFKPQKGELAKVQSGNGKAKRKAGKVSVAA